MVWASIVFAGLSATAWFLAAIVPPSVTIAYWDRPPANIQRRQKAGAVLNALGALFAGFSLACQAITMWPVPAT